MDTITQGALGAVIAEAGFRRRLGGKAVIVGAACGMLPDLDVLTGLAGPWTSLVHHRGASHSLLVLPLVALVAGWAAWHWARQRGSPWQWAHLAAWALLTHPLLDVCTAYGTQLFAPWSRTRFAIDAVAIIDPLYSLPLFVAIGFAARRHGSRMRSRNVAIAVLALTTAYLGLGWIQSQRAIAAASRQLADTRFQPEALRAMPTLFNNQLFRVVARNAEGDLRVGHVSMLAPRPIEFVKLSIPHHDPHVRRALQSRRGRIFAWFAMGFVHAERTHGDRGPGVRITDQRYGLVTKPTRSFFVAHARFDPRGRLREVRRVHDSERDVGRELATMWDRLLGK